MSYAEFALIFAMPAVENAASLKWITVSNVRISANGALKNAGKWQERQLNGYRKWL
jgi:hypothetical protein